MGYGIYVNRKCKNMSSTVCTGVWKAVVLVKKQTRGAKDMEGCGKRQDDLELANSCSRSARAAGVAGTTFFAIHSRWPVSPTMFLSNLSALVDRYILYLEREFLCFVGCLERKTYLFQSNELGTNPQTDRCWTGEIWLPRAFREPKSSACVWKSLWRL